MADGSGWARRSSSRRHLAPSAYAHERGNRRGCMVFATNHETSKKRLRVLNLVANECPSLENSAPRVSDDSRWFCVQALMGKSSIFGMRDGLSSVRGRKSDTKRMRSTMKCKVMTVRFGSYHGTHEGHIWGKNRIHIQRLSNANYICNFYL